MPDVRDEQLVAFCRTLAAVRKLFRRAHILVEKSGRFENVTCTVSHGEKDILDGEQRHPAVEISYSLDSELGEVADDGAYSLGVSVAIYFVRNHWECVGDVGWSCRSVGWTVYQSRRRSYDSASSLLIDLPNFAAEVLDEYDKLIAHHFASGMI